ncbi:TPA: hypothetical protein ACH3X2_011848 [Trebouxia sp. C0005]
MGVGVLCLPVSLVFSDFLAAVNNVLLHRSRSAQVAKLGMLDMDSVAGHAAMLQEKSAAALTEGKLQDNTGSACAYADRQEGVSLSYVTHAAFSRARQVARLCASSVQRSYD